MLRTNPVNHCARTAREWPVVNLDDFANEREFEMGVLNNNQFVAIPTAPRIPKWLIFYRYVRYWCWQAVSKGLLGFIYLAVISEGLRVLVPSLGQKVYKLPLLGSLRDYEATYRLDLAPFFASFLLVGVFVLWPRIIAVWMRDRNFRDWSQEQRLIVALGSGILFADAVLFYYAMTQMTWGQSAFSFSGLVATVAYVGVLVFVSWMSVHLNPKGKEL